MYSSSLLPLDPENTERCSNIAKAIVFVEIVVHFFPNVLCRPSTCTKRNQDFAESRCDFKFLLNARSIDEFQVLISSIPEMKTTEPAFESMLAL